MNSKERLLLERLKSYELIRRDVERLSEKLDAATYKVSANYSLTGGSSGGYGGSKVETYAIRKMEDTKQLEAKQLVLSQIDDARLNASLTKREGDLVTHIINGNSLSSFARQRNIYKSHVYKIRDTALRKMVVHIQSNTK